MDLGAALAGHGIHLRDLGEGEHYYICPRCSHERKKKTATCLSVKIDSNGGAVWRCAHCEWVGNVPGRGFGDDRPAEPPREIRAGRKPPAMPARPAGMVAWFERRKIGAETLEALGVYYAEAYFPQKQRKERAFVFPYAFRGQVVNNKYRSRDKSFAQDTKALRTLYNVDSLIDNDQCIWAEGEMDVISLCAVGFQGVVSLPDGAPAPSKEGPGDPKQYEVREDDKRYEALKTCADELSPIKKFILAVDNDAPGNLLAYHLAKRLGEHNCFRPDWPEGCKDANEVLVTHGPAMLRACIESARGYPIEGLVEIPPGMLRAFRDAPKRERFMVGVDCIDQHLSFRPGQVVVVTGYPTSGKSQFVDWLAARLAERCRWRFAVFSPEHEMEAHAAELAEKHTGMPFVSYDLGMLGMSDEELDLAERWVSRHFVYIVSEREDRPMTLELILEKARAAWLRYRINGLIIDPYNEVHHEFGSLREDQYVAVFMRRLKQFARHHNLVVFLVVHPQKLQRNKDGKRPIPSMHDIAGGANFWNKADIGFTVHRPDFEKPLVDIYVQKVKRKDQGRAGTIEMVWERGSGRYKPR